MTALPIKLDDAKTVDEIVHRVADVAESLGGMDLRELVVVATEAEAAARLVVAQRYLAIHQDADRARRSLQAVAVQAKREAGKRLHELDSEAPPRAEKGRGKPPSPRAQAVRDLGLERTEAARMVQLAEIPDESIPRICEQLEVQGKAVTTTGVLKAAKSGSVLVEGTTRDDCFTEPGFFAPVKKTFGAIDSDLTSCLTAQGWIRARAWWSLRSPHDKEEQARARAAWTAMGWSEAKQAKAIEYAIKTWRGLGGVEGERLTQKPAGATWGQPPYSAPEATIYTITDEYRRKTVTQAIILLNCATSTEVQQHLLKVSSAQLWVSKGEDHPRTRMAFFRPNGVQQKGNDRDQVAYYLGDKPTTFAANFAGWGTVKIG